MTNLSGQLIQHKFFLTTRDRTLLNVFLLGFIMYSLFYVLTTTSHFSYTIGQAAQLLGIGLIVPAAFLLFRYEFESDYLKGMFIFYMIWLAGVVFRGLNMEYSMIKIMLFEAWFGILLYAAPLTLLLPQNLFFYRRLFDLILLFCLFYLALDVLFIKDLIAPHTLVDGKEPIGKYIVETFSKTLGVTAGFILLTYAYHSRSRNMLALITVLVTIVFGIIRARRGLIFMTSLPLMIAFFLYLYRSHVRLKGLMIFLVFSGGLFLNTYAVGLFHKGDLFQQLEKRVMEDTRSGVEVRFFRDLSLQDWVIGKGMMGKYYCPEVPSPNDVRGFRYVIETDFLQIILKGGLISLLLLFGILIPAAVKGIFQSKNLLAKAAGIWIILALINMYPSTVNTFTLNYLLVWVSVGICFSKTIRYMSDETLKLYFRGNL